MTEQRTPTEIDQIADAWVDTLAEQIPTLGTYLGRTEYNDRYGDYSPAGHEALIAETRSTLAKLNAATPVDAIDEVTKTDLSATLELDLELNDAKWALRDLNVIASPAQEIRNVLDLMPMQTTDDWSVISTRLSNLGGAIDGYIETLREGIAQGSVPARRQVAEVITQVERYAADNGYFVEFAGEAKPVDGSLPTTLARELANNADSARAAYGKLAAFLADELAPAASDVDAVGRDLYALHSRSFLGATIDLDETYEWGIDELRRMVTEQTSIANEIKAGASVEEAVAFLEKDESRKLHGTKALQEWMQATSDKAIADLAATHFDIAEPIRKLECMIAPTKEGGIYYTGPTDDFSRPGRMWWSVPEGVDTFDTWRELTTVYHEGVPGHHLQIAQATYNRAELNSWRRVLAGTSGHAEGWALYAERLMEDLGYLSDPADRLGMLDGQRMRAARVVLDIGVHLGKPRLDGDGIWDADYALNFMRKNVNMSDQFVQFEVNRYLGWPGQAPSYKVGQRIWENVRDAYAAKQGENFSIKEFHKRALDLGGVGLDTLKKALLG
ncbi:DUF885 domain-containing protein [Microbacterium sp. NC79]|uniref:DUF885 domain-containing protein n=1 Tax=Microbacterium sp. NC79 TaxID=2851009 RepID=UPI001C2C5A08|nr:DUF885 domain-containing protein [Microbacterium sp. NC79]MBV0894894.1 DUF885 domain-containing protein [Microbacterium sp. NC79]